MRKVIGIGETILDIIFRGDQPSAAVPGGSVFNGIVSLGRMGANVGFISETGNDRVGNIILQFMRDNNIPTDHVNVFPDGKSPVSLAFLNEQSDAEYIFYKDYPKTTSRCPVPQTGRRRHCHDRLLLRLESGIAGKRFSNCSTRRARKKLLSTMTPTSVLHTKTKR